jgi:hypothetical protein
VQFDDFAAVRVPANHGHRFPAGTIILAIRDVSELWCMNAEKNEPKVYEKA